VGRKRNSSLSDAWQGAVAVIHGTHTKTQRTRSIEGWWSSRLSVTPAAIALRVGRLRLMALIPHLDKPKPKRIIHEEHEATQKVFLVFIRVLRG